MKTPERSHCPYLDRSPVPNLLPPQQDSWTSRQMGSPGILLLLSRYMVPSLVNVPNRGGSCSVIPVFNPA